MSTYNGKEMARIANKAADIIEQNGLSCGTMSAADGSHCIQGAVLSGSENVVVSQYGFLLDSPNSSEGRVLEQLALRLGAQSTDKEYAKEATIQDWSDSLDEPEKAVQFLRDAANDFESNVFV